MRLFYTNLFIFTVSIYSSIAQSTMQKDVDQLKAEIEQGVNIDSVTIKLNGIALGAIRKNENNQIIQYIEPVVQAYREEVKSDLNEFGYLSYYLGLAHTNLGNYLNAIPFCEEAEFIAETKQEQDTLLRMQRKIILSHLYSSTGQLKKARQVNKEGLTLASALGNPIYEFRYLINSGNTYQYMGEFNYALSHCKRAIEVVHQSLGDPALLAAAYTNMGASYLSSNQPEEAIKALRKASGFDPNTNNENPEQIYDRLSTIIRYSDLAKAYTKLEVLDSAYIYANKAVTNIKEVFPDGHAFVGDFLLDLGIAYAKKGEFDQARERMKQSIAISDKSLGNVNIASGQAYSNMADTYLEEEDYETAHDLYGKALGAVFKEYSSNVQGPDLLPSKDAVTISPIDAISILHKKAKAYEKEYNEDTSKSKLLQRTNETYTIIIHFIQRFKGDLNDVESRILFSSTFKEIFGEAIASAQQLYVLEQNDKYLIQALNWMEKNKANELFISLNTAFLRETIGDSLLDAESSLKSRITYLKNKNQAAEDASESTEQAPELFQLEGKLNDLKTELRQRYPKYYAIKYGNKDLDITKVRELIESNTTLISYFVTDNEVFYINASTNDMSFGNVGSTSRMKELVSSFNNAVSNTLPGFFDISHELYSFLKPSLSLDKSSLLVIIPDGDLNYLSFDALMTENSADKKQYLLQQVKTLYTPSINYLSLLDNNERNSENNVASIYAPDFLDNQGQLAVRTSENESFLTALPNALDEANSIASLYGTKAMVGSLASETNFKSNIENAGIIHMATHALVDPDNSNNSKLFLESDSVNDGSLYAYELYNMNLEAELVSLSACNTGVGQYKKGEGVMSLARAFMYAGANNVMMSLWAVPDRSTARIMESFYTYIKEGRNKSEALRQAKLDYLANADINTSNPYHWAGFVLVGNVENSESSYNKYAIIGLFLTIALSYFFIRKRRKNIS